MTTMDAGCKLAWRDEQIVQNRMIGISYRQTVGIWQDDARARRRDYWRALRFALTQGDTEEYGRLRFLCLRAFVVTAMLLGRRIDHRTSFPKGDRRQVHYSLPVAHFDEHNDGTGWSCTILTFNEAQFAYSIDYDGECLI